MHDHAAKMNEWNIGSHKNEKANKYVRLFVRAFYLLLGLAMAAGIIHLSSKVVINKQVVLPIQHIEIRTEHENKRIIEISGLANSLKGESFLTVDLETVQLEIAKLDWVNEVSVSRQWPESIVVDIVEETPMAIWSGKQVSLNGVVFEAKGENLNLPRLNVAEDKLDEVIKSYVYLQNIFADKQMYINEISLDKRSSIRLNLNNESVLVLGSKNIEKKAMLAKEIMSDESFVGKIVDMRYENGFSLSSKSLIN